MPDDRKRVSAGETRWRVKSNSVDDGANSARSGRVECQAAEQRRLTEERRTAVDEDDEVDEEHERGWLGGRMGGCDPPRGNGLRGTDAGGRNGGRQNFARARLHPPRPPPLLLPPPPPPPLDAEGSWTARVRCQFCARSPP